MPLSYSIQAFILPPLSAFWIWNIPSKKRQNFCTKFSIEAWNVWCKNTHAFLPRLIPYSQMFAFSSILLTLTSLLEAVCWPQWLHCQHGPAWKLQKLPDIQVTYFLLPQEKKRELLQNHQKTDNLHLFNSCLDKYSKSAQGS